MIPILYDTTETSFSTNGIGRLSDAISCIVTEERNGPYELEMQYPITGQYFSELQHSRIIYATPADGKSGQPFRIYRIEKPLDGICTIYAEHISYQLNHIPVMPFTAESCAAALAGLVSHSGQTNPFTVWTNKSVSGTYKVTEPRPFRELLGGSSGSILDVYGKGEYEFDKWSVKLYLNRGSNTGVVIRYAKNLTELVNDENIEDVYTGVCPFWKNDSGTLVTLPEIAIFAETAANYPYQRTAIIDASEAFENAPTVAQLRSWAQAYIDNNDIGIPKTNIDVEFVPLRNTSGASIGDASATLEIGGSGVSGSTLTASGTVEGDTVYLSDARFVISAEEYKVLERVNLCDTVSVRYDALGVDATAKVIKTTYNVLKDRYDSIELGDAKTTLASQIVDIESGMSSLSQQIDRARSDVTDELHEYVLQQTALITGGLGGYVVFNPNNEAPQEILIMDTPDISTASSVMRLNKNGIGFSTSGYSGPYATAWTINGVFNADYIGAGHISGAYIKAHTLDASLLTVGDSTNLVTVREQYADTMLPTTNSLGGTVISSGYVSKASASNTLLGLSDILASDFVYYDQLRYEFKAYGAEAKTVRVAVILYDGSLNEIERFYSPDIAITTSSKAYSGDIYLDYAHFDEARRVVFPTASISSDTLSLAGGTISNGVLTWTNRDASWRYYAIAFVDNSGTQLYYRDAVVRRKHGGNLIVDGSITAEKIRAGSITTEKLAAGAITAEKISLYGKMGVYTSSSLTTNGGYIGYMAGATSSETSTNGIAIMDENSRNHMIATDSGVRMTNVYTSGGSTLYASLYIANGVLRYTSDGTGSSVLQGNVYLNTTNGTSYSGTTYTGPIVNVNSASGANLFRIAANANGYGGWVAYNDSGNVLAEAGRQNYHGFIGVNNSDGNRRGQLGVSSDGCGSLWIRNNAGVTVATVTAGLASTTIGGRIDLFDNNETPVNRATLYAGTTGGGLILYDSAGNSATLSKSLIDQISLNQSNIATLQNWNQTPTIYWPLGMNSQTTGLANQYPHVQLGVTGGAGSYELALVYYAYADSPTVHTLIDSGGERCWIAPTDAKEYTPTLTSGTITSSNVYKIGRRVSFGIYATGVAATTSWTTIGTIPGAIYPISTICGVGFINSVLCKVRINMAGNIQIAGVSAVSSGVFFVNLSWVTAT